MLALAVFIATILVFQSAVLTYVVINGSDVLVY